MQPRPTSSAALSTSSRSSPSSTQSPRQHHQPLPPATDTTITTTFTEPVSIARITGHQITRGPQPYTTYTIHLSGTIRSWTITKRFSDFSQLNSALITAFPSPPNPSFPAHLPPKHWRHINDRVINERKQKLAEYLNVLLQAPDPRWRRSPILASFLQIPTSDITRAQSAPLHPPWPSFRSEVQDLHATLDSETWIEQYRDIQACIQSIKQMLLHRERAIHESRPSTATTAGITQGLECLSRARKMTAHVSKRLLVLQNSLDNWDTAKDRQEQGMRRNGSYDLPNNRYMAPLMGLAETSDSTSDAHAQGKAPQRSSPSNVPHWRLTSLADADADRPSTHASHDEFDSPCSKPTLSAREISRRQDLLDQLYRERDLIVREINKSPAEFMHARKDVAAERGKSSSHRRVFGAVESGSAATAPSTASGDHQERKESTANSPSASTAIPSTLGRFLGKFTRPSAHNIAPAEAQQTMDTRSILHLQNSIISNQDKHLTEITSVLQRQKAIGTAIGEELEYQNQVLEEMDGQLEKVGRNMKSADKKLKRIS